MSLFVTQLLRHPSLSPIARDVMYAKHPARDGPSGRRYVPTVHTDPQDGPSVFVNPLNKHGYHDRVLPDGRTIEYHSSVSATVNRDLRRLVGTEVVLYAMLGRHECRTGRVVVEKPAGVAAEVFHLRLLPPSEPALEFPSAPVAGPRINWADM